MLNKRIITFAIVSIAIGSLAVSWPWQEQPASSQASETNNQIEKSTDSRLLDLEKQSENLESVPFIEKSQTALDIAGSFPRIPSEAPDVKIPSPSSTEGFVEQGEEKDVEVKVPKVPSARNARVLSRLDKLNKINSLTRIPSASYGTVPSKVSATDVNIPDVKAIQSVPDANVMNEAVGDKKKLQIDRLLKITKSINIQKDPQTPQLQRLIRLSKTHDDVVEALRKAEEESSEVTIIDEEAILEQEAKRLGA